MDQYSREFIAEKARLRPEDLGLVRTARRSHNQLGLAYQIAFIRLTGRAPGQQPFEILGGSDAGSSRENSYTPSPGASTTADWADWISATSNAKPARRAACFSSSQLSSIGRFGRSIVF